MDLALITNNGWCAIKPNLTKQKPSKIIINIFRTRLEVVHHGWRSPHVALFVSRSCCHLCSCLLLWPRLLWIPLCCDKEQLKYKIYVQRLLLFFVDFLFHIISPTKRVVSDKSRDGTKSVLVGDFILFLNFLNHPITRPFVQPKPCSQMTSDYSHINQSRWSNTFLTF